jgi:hypothetical protein
MMKLDIAAHSVAQLMNQTICWRFPKVLITPTVEVVVNAASPVLMLPVAGPTEAISTVVVVLVIVAG